MKVLWVLIPFLIGMLFAVEARAAFSVWVFWPEPLCNEAGAFPGARECQSV